MFWFVQALGVSNMLSTIVVTLLLAVASVALRAYQHRCTLKKSFLLIAERSWEAACEFVPNTTYGTKAQEGAKTSHFPDGIALAGAS